MSRRAFVFLVSFSVFCGAMASESHAGEVLTQEGVIQLAQFGTLSSIPVPRMSNPSGGTLFMPEPQLNMGRSSCETDWIISSRCSRQDWCEAGSRGLQVFRRVGRGCLQPSSFDELRASLDPCTPTAVFVHGSYVEFDWLKKESIATANWLRKCRCGRPLQVIHFTWPSDRDARYLPCSVRELTRRAEFNSFYLARLLGCIPVDCRCGGGLTVIGHSHGALVATAAMHLLAGGSVQGHTSNSRLAWRANVVLAAAAMDRDWLTPRTSNRSLISLDQVCDRGRYDRAMCSVNTMLIMKSRHDIALKLYPLRRLFAKQSLGRTGLWRRDEERLGSAARRIHEVDVSRLLGCKHIWPYYLASNQISCTVGRYILGN